MSIDPEALRAVMRHWATGVAILGAREGPVVHGMTVNSFASVSLEPPLVLVCVEQRVRTHGLIERTRIFSLSILREGQQALSNRFAGRETEQGQRYDGLETFTAVTGAPILADHLGYLDCAVIAAHPAGNHTIFVAEVVAAQAPPAGQPLLYFDRDYRSLAL